MNASVMCSEYVCADASMMCFALQPKGKGAECVTKT